MANRYRTHGRRRMLVVCGAVLAVLAGVAVVVAATRDSSDVQATTAAKPAANPAASSAAKRVPLSKLIGQTLMGRVDGTVASEDVLARIKRGELGGVIVYSNSYTTLDGLKALIASLQDAAKEGGNPPLLIAIDQEGGIVKRLPGPPTLSPQVIGTQGKATARSQGVATGKYLRSFGIDVDLAPVLDVPESTDSFILSRAFGMVPAKVAEVGPAFAAGLQNARVAATAKHFPGLGTATLNTDGASVTIHSTKADLLQRLAPFRAAVKNGTKLVMVSNATYRALDKSGLPASLSPAIVTDLLRKNLGFKGVVITDTMTAPGPGSYSDAGVRALNAGVDVLLYSDGEALSATAFPQILAAARKGDVSRNTLVAAYRRVLALKDWLNPHCARCTS